PPPARRWTAPTRSCWSACWKTPCSISNRRRKRPSPRCGQSSPSTPEASVAFLAITDRRAAAGLAVEGFLEKVRQHPGVVVFGVPGRVEERQRALLQPLQQRPPVFWMGAELPAVVPLEGRKVRRIMAEGLAQFVRRRQLRPPFIQH